MNCNLKKLWAVVLLFLFTVNYQPVSAQDSIKYEIESQTIGTTRELVPFWMRSNQFGSIPLSGISQSFIVRSYKDYSKKDYVNSELIQKKKLIDWGFGFEGRANIGNGSNIRLIEAYGKVRAGIFQLKAGRSKDVMGLNGQTNLSSGNFAISGNALGIPKVELSIPEYWRIPMFDGLFSIRGTFSHGWLGDLQILTNVRDANGNLVPEKDRQVGTYFHQKSLYGRLGKKDWKFNVYGGFNHQVFWGNEKTIFGDNFGLSPFESFFYVATGKAYGGRDHAENSKNTPRSKIGNQLGSIDLGIEYDFEKINVAFYRQNFYDVGALSKLANIRDGLNGIRFKNKNPDKNTNGLSWRNFLFEFFFSKNQAGEIWSPYTNSGDENYYNSYMYAHGWTYKGLSLGNPLITQKQDAVEGQAWNPRDFYINNRVIAFHVGFEGSYKTWDFLIKGTYSNNYGTFATSTAGRTTGAKRELPQYGIFQKVSQSSLFLQTSKRLKNGYTSGLAVAVDQGKLLNNSAGVILQLKKEF